MSRFCFVLSLWPFWLKHSKLEPFKIPLPTLPDVISHLGFLIVGGQSPLRPTLRHEICLFAVAITVQIHGFPGSEEFGKSSTLAPCIKITCINDGLTFLGALCVFRSVVELV